MTRLEDELRATFAARTAELPELDHPAERAIRRAVRTRRRQATLAGLAVMVTIGLVGIGVLHVPWQGLSTQTVVDAQSSAFRVSAVLGIRLDLRVGNQLWTADGRRLPLPGAGAVTWVYRVPAGWVYGGTAGTLRMLLTDGAPADLDQPADAAVVSTDGQRIAWSTGGPGVGLLSIGELTGSGVDAVEHAKIAEQAQPVAIVGSTVLVGQPSGTGKPAAYDVWSPPDVFLPSWKIKLAGVYGEGGDGSLLGLTDDAGDAALKAEDAASAKAAGLPEPDGTDVPVAPVRAPNGACLVRYQVSGGRSVDKGAGVACGLGLTEGSAEGSASPDGQWLAASAATGVMFVSLAQPARPLTRTCPISGRAAPVWEDPGSVLVATDKGLVRCGLDGTRRLIPVDGLPLSDWSVVPSLGVG